MNYFNYFTEIEDEFVKRRGSHILISPLDWSLIETWRQLEIPLPIVLRGINVSFDTYDRLPKRGRKVNSLLYCQQEVEALFQQYRESRVGANESGDPETSSENEPGLTLTWQNVAGFLKDRSETLRSKATTASLSHGLTETLSRAAARVNDLVSALKARAITPDERLESAITRIEALILEGLEAECTPTELKRMRRQAEKQLQSYRAGMGQDIYEQTLRNHLAKHLRDRFEVPRLSLFYM